MESEPSSEKPCDHKIEDYTVKKQDFDWETSV